MSTLANSFRHNGLIRPSSRNPIRLYFSVELWRAVGFMLLSFVLGTFWFIALFFMATLSIGQLFAWIGVPLLVLTVFVGVTGARFERERIAVFLGQPIQSPYQFLPMGPLFSREVLRSRFRLFVSDSAIWRDLLYLLLLFPIGIVELVNATVALPASLAMVTMPVWVSLGVGITIFNIRFYSLSPHWLSHCSACHWRYLLPMFALARRGHTPS